MPGTDQTTLAEDPPNDLARELADVVRRAVCQASKPIVDPAVARYREVEKVLGRHAATRVLGTVPRTTGFAVRTMRRRLTTEARPGLPETRLTPSLLGYVALDEAIVTLAMGPDQYPRRAEYERVHDELAAAGELYRARGWADDPASYHRAPPPLGPDDVQVTAGWAHGLRYERLHFPSEFAPRDEEPGAARWQSFHTNRNASAWVLRHDDDVPRPWLVCIHGFGMGEAFMEFPAFRAAHLHRELGINLIGPTLPLHGRRKVGRFSGDQLLSFDLMNAVHGLTQAAWDVRRVLSWVRAQGPTGVGVYGVSLGGYTTALVSCLDGDLDLALAGIPVTDFPTLFELQSPPVIVQRAIDAGVLGGPAEEAHRVVSPLAMPCLVPPEGRAIYAGLADRLAHPRQAHDLWTHWDQPTMRWYPGNHVGFLWSSKVAGFIDDRLTTRGLTAT